eukprot:gnl/MRDRNA2_/MRDRNA2_89947_c0_seq1.p1 gnl/MRDRNA2_/MRDRNA2_89947_c0~~gnl/MRDRNA2_/MRDRNA2_89947_c0_seq1.p1  ORF type:complete len:214 (+),score=54.71 gnl/MRDRNA2_/MRDRNA2_89947_c0_seq1:86-643(+)
MAAIDRRIDPADGQQLTWSEFRQKYAKKYNLPIASPSPGWQLEHCWVEKCEVVSEESCTKDDGTNLSTDKKWGVLQVYSQQIQVSTELQELSSKAASAVKQVVSKLESAGCTPKLKELKDKASMICSDFVAPKLKEVSSKVTSKLKEVATKAQEVSGKAALTICNQQVKEVKDNESTVSENLRGA